jgi:chorismate-pyruvate lyase
VIARVIAGIAAGSILASCTAPQQLTQFERTLAAQDSATAALTDWCQQQGIARPARISAVLVPDGIAPPADLRRLLDLPAGSDPGYRHVRLSCGGKVLSDAHNWYVPARLPPAMNDVLRTTDIPFGKTVAALNFKRERLDSRRGRAAPCPAGTILSHRALLRLPDGQPLALVVECYTRANLGS